MPVNLTPSSRVALITGAGSGIGAEIAAALHEAGTQVAILDVDAAAARDRARQLGADALALTADVTDEDAVHNAIAQVVDRFDGLDLLINNAAITATRSPELFGVSVLEHSVAQWRRVIDVNLTGAFICAQQAAQQMVRSGGLIINIASVQGVRPTRGSIDYATSKAGLIMLTRCLAGELAPYRIRVNAVAPGPIAGDDRPDTTSGTLTESWGTPADVAAAVLFLASPGARFVNGEVFMVDDGASVRLREAPARTEDDA